MNIESVSKWLFSSLVKKKKKRTERLDLKLTNLSKPQFLHLYKNNHIIYLICLLEELNYRIHVKSLVQYSRLKMLAMMMIMKRMMMARGEPGIGDTKTRSLPSKEFIV